ncbi:uncharacterized protein LOC129292000 [Prosopis cineraria]|uniref:uncharacterized protein LOC129292000 n=1 Tax=Prosopis cineraria TaxID=364024 RepID=UPI0024107821|nr:uncharacterized protein LOC129292000 [Prosopis cineraria]
MHPLGRASGKALPNPALSMCTHRERKRNILTFAQKKGEGGGTTFTKIGWKAIISGFTEKNMTKDNSETSGTTLGKTGQHGINYFPETGFGWDSAKNMVDTPDEDDWWEKKQLENPQYTKFRYKALLFAQELAILFKDVVTSNSVDDEDDAYCTSIASDCVDLEEGSGNGEEDLQGAPAGPVSHHLRNMNLITSYEALSERNTSKRKRVGYSESEGKKKQKVTASEKIAGAERSRIDEPNKARRTAVNTLILPGTSAAEIMAEILTV